MAPLPGVQQLQGDITKLATANRIVEMIEVEDNVNITKLCHVVQQCH